jgi:sodium-dependent dicarboxylate transporter 2/3/5
MTQEPSIANRPQGGAVPTFLACPFIMVLDLFARKMLNRWNSINTRPIMSRPHYPFYKRLGWWAGPALFVLIVLLPTPAGMNRQGQFAAALAALMATWWLTEAIPLAATALVPLAMMPLLGVLPAGQVASAYGDSNIFLFAGGFFIAMAVQKWGLHERIALNVVLRVSTNLRLLVLGFMVTSAMLSMWISNTATTLMMLPIALGVADEIGKRAPERVVAPFAVCLMLGIAYSASIGGIGTLIGTPPNVIFNALF